MVQREGEALAVAERASVDGLLDAEGRGGAVGVVKGKGRLALAVVDGGGHGAVAVIRHRDGHFLVGGVGPAVAGLAQLAHDIGDDLARIVQVVEDAVEGRGLPGLDSDGRDGLAGLLAVCVGLVKAKGELTVGRPLTTVDGLGHVELKLARAGVGVIEDQGVLKIGVADLGLHGAVAVIGHGNVDGLVDGVGPTVAGRVGLANDVSDDVAVVVLVIEDAGEGRDLTSLDSNGRDGLAGLVAKAVGLKEAKGELAVGLVRAAVGGGGGGDVEAEFGGGGVLVVEGGRAGIGLGAIGVLPVGHRGGELVVQAAAGDLDGGDDVGRGNPGIAQLGSLVDAVGVGLALVGVLERDGREDRRAVLAGGHAAELGRVGGVGPLCGGREGEGPLNRGHRAVDRLDQGQLELAGGLLVGVVKQGRGAVVRGRGVLDLGGLERAVAVVGAHGDAHGHVGSHGPAGRGGRRLVNLVLVGLAGVCQVKGDVAKGRCGGARRGDGAGLGHRGALGHGGKREAKLRVVRRVGTVDLLGNGDARGARGRVGVAKGKGRLLLALGVDTVVDGGDHEALAIVGYGDLDRLIGGLGPAVAQLAHLAHHIGDGLAGVVLAIEVAA